MRECSFFDRVVESVDTPDTRGFALLGSVARAELARPETAIWAALDVMDGVAA